MGPTLLDTITIIFFSLNFVTNFPSLPCNRNHNSSNVQIVSISLHLLVAVAEGTFMVLFKVFMKKRCIINALFLMSFYFILVFFSLKHIYIYTV